MPNEGRFANFGKKRLVTMTTSLERLKKEGQIRNTRGNTYTIRWKKNHENRSSRFRDNWSQGKKRKKTSASSL